MRARPAALAAVLLASASAASADPYVVCDNGLRCVRAPCPSTNVLDLGSGAVLKATGADLARLSAGDRDRADRESASYKGTLAFDGAVVDVMTNDAGHARPAPLFVAAKIVRATTAAERRQCRGDKGGKK